MHLREAIVIVGQGRAHQRENFPGGHPGKFVGRIPSEMYNEALDVLISEAGPAVAERCSVRHCPYPRLTSSPCCFGHVVDESHPAHIDGKVCE